jgi:hypothetical protein
MKYQPINLYFYRLIEEQKSKPVPEHNGGLLSITKYQKGINKFLTTNFQIVIFDN